MNINRYLDLSTAHIPEDDNNFLMGGDAGWPYCEDEYGYWIWVPTELDAQQRDYFNRTGLSARLWHVLEVARAHDCNYVRLDRDGPEFEELPTFNW